MTTAMTRETPSMPQLETDTTIVVPVRMEEKNIPILLERLHTVADSHNEPFRVVLVDDSLNEDGTPNTDGVAASARMSQKLCGGSCKHLAVEHILRTDDGAKAVGGLSGAVMDGIAVADTTYVVVMDGDLQHPPETIPNMLAQIRQDYDIIPASRYIKGGSSAGLSGLVRHLVSRACTLAAKVLHPYTLRGVKDPMTGFFAVRREAIRPSKHQPMGFKVLFYILHANKQFKRTEVPLKFVKREHGESKGDLKQGLLFLKQLALYRVRM